ncbi:phosphatidate phosphatase APP1 [Sugiyamaella lignohabitans]|uniref:Phosphatidate phosphatase APP1 n=1 Tax=Sugiyamaella lignohabitans TaxID=796027 RepID=A0A167CIM6_9ASCO|nr:phosphatidate phosphatase APP1 [Sugiyamaella lignohabitans]ANB11749.1 phosphatidate phosphatase APP1 [Sugiyamaella lignohabitans]
MASSNGHGGFYGQNVSSSTSFSSSSATSWVSRKDQVVKFLKTKRDEYISADTNGYGAGISRGIADPDNDHLAFQLSRLPREAAFRQAEVVRPEDKMYINGPPPPNPPFRDESLTLYPSYSRKLDSGEYDVDVRGRLYLPAVLNRKARIAQSVVMRFSGLTSGGGNTAANTPSLDQLNGVDFSNYEYGLDEQDVPGPQSTRGVDRGIGIDDGDLRRPIHHTSTTSTTSSQSSRSSRSSRFSNEEETFKERFATVLTRGAPDRELKVRVGLEGNHQSVVAKVTTFSDGRFLIRIRVPSRPAMIHVEASDDVHAIIEPLVIGDTKDSKISVITDIDDTIKHTGIATEKRQVFRNVLARHYDDIAIEGVVDWYSDLEKEGVKFHYVSNSPWQLYPVIAEYMSHTKLPKGSIHLKPYTGLISGMLEPSSEKKKVTLHNVVKDFPDRRFILIGDSGEKDLEAYYDLATQFPKQILAIYIRDVTLPADDIFLQEYIAATGYIPTPGEIDSYESSAEAGRSGRMMARQQKLRDARGREAAQDRSIGRKSEPKSEPEPRSVANSAASIPDLIDLSDPEPAPAQPEREREQDLDRPSLPPRPNPTTTTTTSNSTTSNSSSSTTTNQPLPLSPHKVPRKAAPPIPQKPANLRPPPHANTVPPEAPWSRLSAANTTAHSRLNEPVHSKSEVNGSGTHIQPTSSSTTETPPPLPPRRVATVPTTNPKHTNSSVNPDVLIMNSEQNDYGQLVLDKKVEQWKSRYTRSRMGLPGGIKLRMWKVGSDLRDESIALVRDNRAN